MAVRLRRDFGAILELIRVHAVLHQATREKTPDGTVIANIDDYRVIRGLVADLIAEQAEHGVSRDIVEVVETVRSLFVDEALGVRIARVGAVLKLDKVSAWRRVRRAIERGFLKNDEERNPLCLAHGTTVDPVHRGWDATR